MVRSDEDIHASMDSCAVSSPSFVHSTCGKRVPACTVVSRAVHVELSLAALLVHIAWCVEVHVAMLSASIDQGWRDSARSGVDALITGLNVIGPCPKHRTVA
jgi:hypothetical protein